MGGKTFELRAQTCEEHNGALIFKSKGSNGLVVKVMIAAGMWFSVEREKIQIEDASTKDYVIKKSRETR